MQGILAEEGATDRAQVLAGRRASEDSPLKGIVELAAVQPAKLEAPAVPEIMQPMVRCLDTSTALRRGACAAILSPACAGHSTPPSSSCVSGTCPRLQLAKCLHLCHVMAASLSAHVCAGGGIWD